MKCRHENELNDANFCIVECRYCTLQQSVECKSKHPEYFKVDITSAEEIRKQIVESVFNNPKLGENYVDWHTEDGECGLTLMFKNAKEEFEIIIRKK